MSICPAGGFFFQSTSGDRGNFEVVIPGPEFGLWHYWRDNDDSALPWHGPNKFAEGFRFTSVTVCESDYRTHDNEGDRPQSLSVRASCQSWTGRGECRGSGRAFFSGHAPLLVKKTGGWRQGDSLDAAIATRWMPVRRTDVMAFFRRAQAPG